METKFCNKCKLEKSVERFHRLLRKGKISALQSQCKDCIRNWVVNNREKTRASSLERYNKNPKKFNEVCSKWASKNKDKVRKKTLKYHSARRQRTPKWLTKSDWIEIKWAYAIAREKSKITGTLHHVDHILPLQGDRISGLHTPSNLRVIPYYENSRKRNKHG